jgi:hypothetical protein
MTTEQTQISAAANPALANKLVEEALSEQEVSAPAPAVKVQLPPDTQVELPGGLFDPFDGTITTAEVRELTGADEEAISKINDSGKALLSILERATVKIGDKPADKDTLESLLAGDREMILLAIRKVTFGSDVTLELNCPHCGQAQLFEIDLDKDVEIKKLDGDETRFEVNCKVGKVMLSLPNGNTQKTLVSSSDKTSAELDTIILKGCISSINGMPILNTQEIRNLSIKDRRELLNEISKRNPGPQLSEIKKDCTACGQEVPLPLTLADLFR